MNGVPIFNFKGVLADEVNDVIHAAHKLMLDAGVDLNLRVTPHSESFRQGAIEDVQNLEGLPAHKKRHAKQRAGHQRLYQLALGGCSVSNCGGIPRQVCLHPLPFFFSFSFSFSFFFSLENSRF